ncbi:MAG TPA: hypothetical protein VN653_19495, partial [Anaerolineales bacterium]|nr:hypothetical protein [Anaerolineales bacterium]
MLLVILIAQGACTNGTVSAPTTPSKEVIPVTDTSTPTQSPRPSKTPSPTAASTPSIIGNWSDEPAMLIPRSAHAVTNSD